MSTPGVWATLFPKILSYTNEQPILFQGEGGCKGVSLTELFGGVGLQSKSTTGYLTGPQLCRRTSEKASLVDWCHSYVHNKPRKSAAKDGLNLGQVILSSA